MNIIPEELLADLPAIGSTDGQGGDAVALVKLFTPDSSWTWYLGAATAESADTLELAGIEYQSFLVASTLTHDDKLVTIGVLGMVFVVDE